MKGYITSGNTDIETPRASRVEKLGLRAQYDLMTTELFRTAYDCEIRELSALIETEIHQ